MKWLGAVQIALPAKSLIILPILTHKLGTGDYGVWSQVAVITAVAAPLMNWGTSFGFVRRKAGAPIEERARLFRAWVYALVTAFVVVLAMALAAADPLTRHVLGSPEQGTALVAFAVLLAFSGMLLNAEVAWLKLNGESHIHAMVLLADAVLAILAVVAFVLIQGSVVHLAGLTFLADVVLVSGLFVRHLRRHGWGEADFKAFWSAFRYGLPLMPLSFANAGINWVDRIVLLRYLSISDVGIYSLAHAIAQMAVQAFTQPVRAYYPTRATAAYNLGNLEAVRTLYGLSAGTTFAVQVPAAIGLFFVAPTFIAIIAPPSFTPSPAVLPLVFIGYAIDRQATYSLLVFEWQMRQHWVTITQLGTLALNLLLNLLLIPRFGLIGAGIANVVAFAIRYLFVQAMVSSTTPLRANPTFIVKVVAASAIMGFGLWLLPDAPPSTGLWRTAGHLAVQVTVGVVVYLTALMALGGIASSGVKAAFSRVVNL